MKNNRGFISNSSTCSFFLDPNKFQTTNEVAYFMIEDQFEWQIGADDDWRDTLDKKSKAYKKCNDNRKRLQQILQGVDLNEAIVLNTIQFPTYIRQVDRNGKKYIYVATCNNLQWTPRDYTVAPDGTHDGAIYDGEHDREYINGNEFFYLNKQKRFTPEKAWDDPE